MAVRIYSLAKELKLDSKDLVDMLPKAGISGKGSALASLTDEEEVKFRDFFARKSRPAERPSERPLDRLERPGDPAGERVLKDLTRPKPAPLAKSARPVSPAQKAPPAGDAPAPAPAAPAGTSPPVTPAREPSVPTDPAPRLDPVSPTIAAERSTSATVADKSSSSDDGGMDSKPMAGNTPLAPPSPVRPETSRGDNPRTDIAASATDSPKASPPSKPREGFSGRTSPLGGRVGQLHRGASATSTLTATGSTLDSAPLRRDDYIPPGGVVRAKPQMLTGRKEPDSEGGEDKTKQRGKKEPPKPTIRVAPINLAPLTPPKPQKSNEPAPQKPVIRLPVDVIKSSKAGGAKPLEAHMKRSEAKTAEQPKGRAVAKALTPEEEKEAKKKGKSGPAEQQDMLLGGREGRLKTRKEKDVQKPKAKVEDEDAPVGRISRPVNRNKIIRRGSGSTAAPRKSKIVLQIPCSVREFSEAAGISAAQVLGKLLGMGKMVTITGLLDDETAEFLALEFGVEVELRKPADAEETLLSDADAEDDPATLLSRPPVITFLGHVDHGKTSLLDKIIGIDVASGESGGITQHIRAYQIEHHGRQISFVDTPGHEAFTEMRARGANVTDIAVLVVAADDGVMPQTEEAISHARAAGVPIVVALNKIDLPGVDEQKIFSQLATAGLLPTEWGGEVEVVRTSALTGKGLDDLLETLFTIAELHELRANPDRLAVGTCLEAEVHGDRGVIAKFIVQRGTLRVGDAVVCGSASGYIKAMFNTLKPREKLEEAGPSTPVNITGLDTAPSAGQHFYAVKDISQAREVASKREIRQRDLVIGGKGTQHITLETILERISTEQAKNLNLILRADTRGSIEAILKEFTKLEHPEVKIKVLQASVGGISEADIHLADASDAIVLGFNVVPDEKARGLAEQRGVQIRRYEIIYKLTEDLKAALEGMLKPEQREMDLGRALVQRTFAISRVGTIAGCRVLSGIIPRNARMRVIRDSRVIGEYSIETLKREKDDAKEVREGLECGIKLAGYNDIKEGDILEAYRIEEIARTL